MKMHRKSHAVRKCISMLLIIAMFISGLLILEPIKAYAASDNNIAVSLGGAHSAVIKADGSLWLCGRNNAGQLGNGTRTNSKSPFKLMDGVKAVSLGSYNSAAIKTDGSLWTWGGNQSGELGNGTTTYSEKPIKIMNGIKAVDMGQSHSAAIKTDDSLWLWGMVPSECLGMVILSIVGYLSR